MPLWGLMKPCHRHRRGSHMTGLSSKRNPCWNLWLLGRVHRIIPTLSNQSSKNLMLFLCPGPQRQYARTTVGKLGSHCSLEDLHPDGCSCTTARRKALVEGISEGLANSLLQCPAEAKTALERIVQVINNGGAESVVSDITLRTTATRPADQSPYEVSLVASAEGQMFRSSLQAITQPDSPGENTRDRPEKCWEVSALQTSSWGAGGGTMSSARPDCVRSDAQSARL